jgi:hypothetical protein
MCYKKKLNPEITNTALKKIKRCSQLNCSVLSFLELIQYLLVPGTNPSK